MKENMGIMKSVSISVGMTSIILVVVVTVLAFFLTGCSSSQMGSTLGNDAESSPVEKKSVDGSSWCDVGSFTKFGNSVVEITAKEEMVFDNKTMAVCLEENYKISSDDRKEILSRKWTSEDGKYTYQRMFSDGQISRASMNYPGDDGKLCFKTFDSNLDLVDEGCR